MDRLISADALDREMYRKSFEVDDGRNVWNSGLWIRYKIFEEAIRDAPTIDAEPVRHGRWKQVSERYVTSALRFYVCTECGEKSVGATNYCSHCGARMDGERKEE